MMIRTIGDAMINTDIQGSLSWLNDRPLMVSMSGGKDSTALGLYLKRQGIRFTPVFCDTGWEHPATYDYIRDVLEPAFGRFVVLRNESLWSSPEGWRGGMETAVYKHKIFPSGVVKFCTRELKVTPAQNYFSSERLRLGVKPINAVGIRAEESAKRSTMEEVEEQDEATVWRPLIKWTEEQVIALHREEAMPPNPLYIKGAARVGCFPCIYARKSEIRHMSYTAPERIHELAELERRLNEHRAAHGKEPTATFFKSRREDKTPMFIADIVEWSRQDRRQGYVDDVDEIEDEGCMRWGLCERPEPVQLSLFSLLDESR